MTVITITITYNLPCNRVGSFCITSSTHPINAMGLKSSSMDSTLKGCNSRQCFPFKKFQGCSSTSGKMADFVLDTGGSNRSYSIAAGDDAHQRGVIVR